MIPVGVSLPMLSAQLAQVQNQVKQMQGALANALFSRDTFAAIVSVAALAAKAGEKIEVDEEGRLIFTKDRVLAAQKAYAVQVLAKKLPAFGDMDPSAILHDFFVVAVALREDGPKLATPAKPTLVVP